jgi:hypothetical protein
MNDCKAGLRSRWAFDQPRNQQNRDAANVRFGSFCDIDAALMYVRFLPHSGTYHAPAADFRFVPHSRALVAGAPSSSPWCLD